MQVSQLLEVQNGDALGSLRTFLADWWEQYRPDALLAPIEDARGTTIVSQIIEDPADLRRVNPFAPLMTSNAAGAAYHLQQQNGRTRVAAILRPCELRSYAELYKRQSLQPPLPEQPEEARDSRMLIFGVDCMGTYSRKFFDKKLKDQNLPELTKATLMNASAGGFRQQNLRQACQMCDWPAPWGADVVIGTVGVETERHLLVTARREAGKRSLKAGRSGNSPAAISLLSHRETIVSAVADARAGVRKGLLASSVHHSRFDDVGSILGWFATCSLCGECLGACPTYSGEFDPPAASGRKPVGPLANMVLLSRWLASCSGCGMCEEVCQRSVPLTLLVSALSHRIREETDYITGSPDQPPPWAGD